MSPAESTYDAGGKTCQLEAAMSNPETVRPRRTELSNLVIRAVRVSSRPSLQGAMLRVLLAVTSAAVGLLVGIVFAAANPRPQTSDASVLFITPFTLAPVQSQAEPAAMARLLAVARSRPVLASAAEALKPTMSLQALQRQVQATIVRSDEVQISVQSATSARAQKIANAVAGSYMSYANEKLPDDPPMMVGTTLSQGPSHLDYILECGASGASCGGLLAAIGSIAIRRRRTRWSQYRP